MILCFYNYLEPRFKASLKCRLSWSSMQKTYLIQVLCQEYITYHNKVDKVFVLLAKFSYVVETVTKPTEGVYLICRRGA